MKKMMKMCGKMTRLIDANALRKKCVDLVHCIDAEAVKEDYYDGMEVGVQNVIVFIDVQPTVDIEPHWIPCSERLPEEPFGCLVTVWDTDPVTMDEFENILPYFVGWDGEQWNDADGEQCPFEVLAWMPLPKPYEVGR